MPPCLLWSYLFALYFNIFLCLALRLAERGDHSPMVSLVILSSLLLLLLLDVVLTTRTPAFSQGYNDMVQVEKVSGFGVSWGAFLGFFLALHSVERWWHEDQGMWRKEVRAHFWEGVQWCRVPSILPSFHLHFSEAKHHVWSNGWSRIQLGWDHLGFTCPGIPPGWGGCSRELCCTTQAERVPSACLCCRESSNCNFCNVSFALHK